jgi:arginyl-tRNA synthetase
MKDFELIKELNLTMENEVEDYKKEEALAKNYARKLKSGKFDFKKAHKGVLNLVVVPRARKYTHSFGVKIPKLEREEVAKARLRAIIRRIKEEGY